MSFYIYVLKNDITGKLYKGQTQNLELRLKEHSYSHTKTTSNHAKDWKLIYFEEFSSKSGAIKREKELKRKKSKHYIEKYILRKKNSGGRPE